METNENLDDVKDVLHSINSDSDIVEEDDDSRDATLKIEDNITNDSKMDLDISFPDVSKVKPEPSDFHIDLSFPQPAHIPPEKKKDTRTKKEIEEEEREKMQ